MLVNGDDYREESRGIYIYDSFILNLIYNWIN